MVAHLSCPAHLPILGLPLRSCLPCGARADAEACESVSSYSGATDNSATAGTWIDEAWIVRGEARPAAGGCSRRGGGECTRDEPAPPPAPPAAPALPNEAAVDVAGRAAAFVIGLVSGVVVVGAVWACVAKRGGGHAQGHAPSPAASAKAQQLQEIRMAELPADTTAVNVRVTD